MKIPKEQRLNPEQTIYYKLELYLSKDLIPEMIELATSLGACEYDRYDHVASYYEIEGCWRPSERSNPVTGEKNTVNYGKEYKLELRCKEQYVKAVLGALRKKHPYEEAVIHVIRLDNHLFE
ncbi:MAG: cytochrome C biogenesis protein [Clostridiales bacterium]|nr:cytochrome C biogenesis protein [Clostridiales bacterium]